MQRAFVAGATGLTGRAVVEALRARAVEPYAHVRPDSSRLAHWREHFGALGAEVDTTAWEAEALTARLHALQPSFVFALLGTTRKRERADGASTYEQVDYGLTHMLLQAARACGWSPRFVYLSAAGAGPRARGAYMAVRWRIEQELRGSGLSYVIARPSWIVGERDQARPMEEVGATLTDAGLALGSLLGAGRLRERYRSTHASDLAAAMVRAALDETSSSIIEGTALRA